MSIIEAIILGIVQGLTEFLPVSSSGHIELGKAIFNIQEKEAGLLFTVVLHFATALSTIIVFWKDIVGIFRGLFKFRWNEETRFAVLVVLSMVPAVLVGVFFKDSIDDFYDGNVLLVSVMLLITGVVLYFSDRAKNPDGSISEFRAFILGIVQAIAIMPGISRSGSTIATAVMLGIKREKAARFSFLMVLPLIFGAMAMEFKDYFELSTAERSQALILDSTVLLGFIAALVSGYFACKWMIEIVKKSKLTYFAVYCWIVGAIGIVYTLVQ
ncbi:MAG: undecaprenyl-diphosphate phosphatase [Bacteroidia bacterium]|nr:undecaprenyl-diphosphate phosphatase [Bacteroidia bacterium]NNJ54634.1 undecaprenyl-diphosphate phosphatase [Bacteroidia bacterium]